MDKLIDYICEELEQLERKADKDGKLTMSEVQYLDVLAHAKKNLLKGEELYEEMEGGYSQRSGRYSGESSYARGRGRNARRDSMGRYSRERYSRGGSIMEELHELMENAPDDRTRAEYEKMIDKMEHMR